VLDTAELARRPAAGAAIHSSRIRDFRF